MDSELEALTIAETLDAEDLELGESLDAASLEAVEVTTDWAEGRKRQLSARVQMSHPVEQIWQILTDYDRLADFIPNLAKSQRIERPQGGIRIEQVGTQALLKIKFRARVILDMVEHFPHRIDFEMVEGDFKEFSGNWTLQPIDLPTGQGTDLCYTLTVLPPRTMPIGMIERRLKGGLVLNLAAIRQEADQRFGAVGVS